MNKNIGVIIGVIIIAGIVFLVLSNQKTDQKGTQGEIQNNTATDATKTNDAQMEQEAIKNTDTNVEKKGTYESYNAEKIALAETGKVVLFFHASWCPSCRTLNGNIEKNATEIPDKVTILKTDYDKETDLKKRYGVTSQHTLVQVDKDGALIKKWSGGSTLENLLSQIN